MTSSGADVLSVDWRISMKETRQIVGSNIALQGNLDPGALYGPPEEIRRQVREILKSAGSGGHIFNLGGGIFPDTPVEHAQEMVKAVHEESENGV